MATQQEATEKLRKMLRRAKVVELEALLEACDTRSRMTVFRRLRKLDYLSSYSHSGSYYTLQDIPAFDERGLWFHGDIGFSRTGTLKQTVAVQVEQAPEGRTHRELERLLRVRVRNTLLALVRQGRIGRERWQRSYLYVSAEPDRAGRVVGIASPSMHGAKRMVVPTENLRELLSWDGSPHEVLEEVETAYRYACLRLKKHNRGPLARGRVRPIPENKDHECQLAQSVIDLVEHANEAAVPDAAVRDYAQPAVTRWIYHVGTAYVALRTLVESDGKIRLAVNFIDPGHTPARQKGTANNQLGANEEHELFRLIVAKAMEDGSSELESRRILLDRLDDPAFRDKEGLRKSTYTMRTLERATEPIRARIRELQQQGMDQ